MRVQEVFVLLTASLFAGGASAKWCNNQPSLIWQCLRSDNSNSGYTASCCPGGSFMQDGFCCTNNWRGFQSCCHAHNGYRAANG
ncbi:uncharacterized protein CTRU02_206276 [Colletotrichum truncatum]|uniref:Uncharacterized protein n=1 Tax=Colletotrichum truncatum TaxID=5467 RepID=A0ACC3Z6E7_COLTU|nr:uncharacterized protein CTRU02_09885 [Colletotrichum truncatum]KAF6788072.1 hypothetical protein CTRU02_09885 [Colletotrichum truncatum]